MRVSIQCRYWSNINYVEDIFSLQDFINISITTRKGQTDFCQLQELAENRTIDPGWWTLFPWAFLEITLGHVDLEGR